MILCGRQNASCHDSFLLYKCTVKTNDNPAKWSHLAIRFCIRTVMWTWWMVIT